MTRYFLSTDDDGPNVLFSGTKAELVYFVTSQLLSGADTRPHDRSLPFRRGDGEQGVEPRTLGIPAAQPSAPPTFAEPFAFGVSLADHIENGAWPQVCDMDGWEATE